MHKTVMETPSSGARNSRSRRLRMIFPGIYGCASLEFLYMIKGQYKDSSQIDKKPAGKNWIPILTLPLLLSCIRILALEIQPRTGISE
jgi:hypothetical protein